MLTRAPLAALARRMRGPWRRWVSRLGSGAMTGRARPSPHDRPRRARAWTPVRALFVALALMVKALVPAGLMLSPAAASAGLSPIVLCTGSGEIHAFMNAAGAIVEQDAAGAADPAADHDPDGPCGFAAQAGAFTPAAAPGEPVTHVAAARALLARMESSDD